MNECGLWFSLRAEKQSSKAAVSKSQKHQRSKQNPTGIRRRKQEEFLPKTER